GIAHRADERDLDRRRRGRLAELDRGLPERGADGRPEPVVPAVEIAEEVATRVGLTAFDEPPGPGGCQPRVDQLRHRLVGAGPVLVAAPEDGVAHTLQAPRAE